MIRKPVLLLLLLGFSAGVASSQSFITTNDLFKRTDDNHGIGQLHIVQNPAIDSLVYRYILMSRKIYDENGYYGMEGWRIQIYSSASRNAREESNKINADFIDKFPEIESYILFAQPGYYKVRVGNFRTKTEAMKLFLTISKVFPDAYFVPDIIYFPDENNN